MPVLACTDPNTDIGTVAEEGGFGVWCQSNNPENFTKAVDKLLSANLTEMGEAGYNYLLENYTSKQSANIIISKL